MDRKIIVSQEFNSNPQGSRLRGRPKTDGGTVYRHIEINAKLKTRKKGHETEMIGGSAAKANLHLPCPRPCRAMPWP